MKTKALQTSLKKKDTNDFSKTLDSAKEWAKSVGYKKSDVNKIIKSKRRSK